MKDLFNSRDISLQLPVLFQEPFDAIMGMLNVLPLNIKLCLGLLLTGLQVLRNELSVEVVHLWLLMGCLNWRFDRLHVNTWLLLHGKRIVRVLRNRDFRVEHTRLIKAHMKSHCRVRLPRLVSPDSLSQRSLLFQVSLLLEHLLWLLFVYSPLLLNFEF